MTTNSQAIIDEINKICDEQAKTSRAYTLAIMALMDKMGSLKQARAGAELLLLYEYAIDFLQKEKSDHLTTIFNNGMESLRKISKDQ